MVVLSASVCTGQGKALVSRQFVEMNRLRIEGLLAAFPKLLGSDQQQQQHTFVSTDTVRYVYQPLENGLYLLLITTKASNIVEDLSTLRLLAKLVPDVAGGFSEAAIADAAFDLIFAFDEVITAGGYKEEITLPAIRTNLEMDSHEERVAIAMQEEKKAQANEKMRTEQKRLANLRLQNAKDNFMGNGITNAPMSSGHMQGFGSDQYNNGPSGDMFQEQQSMPSPDDPYANLYNQNQSAVPDKPSVVAKTGMKLGKKSAVGGTKNNALFASMAQEDNMFKGAMAGGANSFGLTAAAPAPAAPPSTPLTVVLEEKVTAKLNREGVIENAEVKGTLTVTANTEAGTMALISVNKAQLPSQFTYSTHPKVDKKGYETKNGQLAIKGGKGLPAGRAIGILRWAFQGDEAAPLTINCWPEDDGTGCMNVNIEMELVRPDLVLNDVNIVIPTGSTQAPQIEAIDGIYKHDANNGMMCWHFDTISASENSNASLEFTIAGSNSPDNFFPVQVHFRSESLQCPVQIVSVTHAQNGTVVPHQATTQMVQDSYECA